MDAENCGHREFCKRRYRPRQLKYLTEDCPATGIVRLWNSLWSCVNTAFAERLVTCLVDGGGHAELSRVSRTPIGENRSIRSRRAACLQFASWDESDANRSSKFATSPTPRVLDRTSTLPSTQSRRSWGCSEDREPRQPRSDRKRRWTAHSRCSYLHRQLSPAALGFRWPSPKEGARSTCTLVIVRSEVHDIS